MENPDLAVLAALLPPSAPVAAPTAHPQPVQQNVVTAAPPREKSQTQLAILAVMQTLALILAVRFFLFLSLVGGFVLALLATQSQTSMGLIVMVAYCVLIVLPMVWLETRVKR